MTINRYRDINIRKEENKIIYQSIIYPKITQEVDDTVITVGVTDRLDLLAYDYYGDSTLYWIISRANDIVTNDLFPEIGTQLIIPNKNRLSKILSDLRNLNEQ